MSIKRLGSVFSAPRCCIVPTVVYTAWIICPRSTKPVSVWLFVSTLWPILKKKKKRGKTGWQQLSSPPRIEANVLSVRSAEAETGWHMRSVRRTLGGDRVEAVSRKMECTVLYLCDRSSPSLKNPPSVCCKIYEPFNDTQLLQTKRNWQLHLISMMFYV